LGPDPFLGRMIGGMGQATKTLALVLGVTAAGAGAVTTEAGDASAAIRLIVRGDDMGSTQSSNQAHIDCYRDGVMRTAEVMAVGPWFPEAARLLRENPGLDVGLHLALTSEWDNVKWRPLTHAPSLVEEGGWFFPMIFPNEDYGRERALEEQPWVLDEIEGELRAQIELTRREVPRLSHLTGHMGFAEIGAKVGALVKRLATEYDLDIDPREHGVSSLDWEEPRETPAEKVETFARMLENLGPGTWRFVDHPAYDDPEMRAAHHVGYEDVAVDRQGVVEAWTSPKVKEIVARRGIELIAYRDLVDE
jgi:predicted glycoside hydrolase/deacetylase ChbG (UPF0249 family)